MAFKRRHSMPQNDCCRYRIPNVSNAIGNEWFSCINITMSFV